jgi:hypothetical protein
MEVIAKEANSLYSTNIKSQISLIIYTGWSFSFLTSAAILEVQTGEMFKLVSLV